jgi:hypothetical protein
MIKKLTKPQLEAFRHLLEQYMRLSENAYYDVKKVNILAHPEDETTIYFSAEISGIKDGDLFDEKRYMCVDSEGTESNCFKFFTSSVERQEFYDELVTVKINNDGSIEKV